jgi:hypothetical protein
MDTILSHISIVHIVTTYLSKITNGTLLFCHSHWGLPNCLLSKGFPFRKFPDDHTLVDLIFLTILQIMKLIVWSSLWYLIFSFLHCLFLRFKYPPQHFVSIAIHTFASDREIKFHTRIRYQNYSFKTRHYRCVSGERSSYPRSTTKKRATQRMKSSSSSS